jgi:hypothetical protein
MKLKEQLKPDDIVIVSKPVITTVTVTYVYEDGIDFVDSRGNEGFAKKELIMSKK